MWKVKTDEKYSYYEFQVYIKLDAPDKAFYFYNCDGDKMSYDLEYELVPTIEDYPEIPNLPSENVYSILLNILFCCCFLVLGLYWIHLCRKSQ